METSTAVTRRPIPKALKPFTSYKAEGWEVRFVPVENVPGYTHRVLISFEGQQIARDWLGDTHKPSAKTALYYVQKHA